MVYGQPIKNVIHEKFGDGIMSAIAFSADVQKKTSDAGDRVVITFNGKVGHSYAEVQLAQALLTLLGQWLPYAWSS